MLQFIYFLLLMQSIVDLPLIALKWFPVVINSRTHYWVDLKGQESWGISRELNSILHSQTLCTDIRFPVINRWTKASQHVSGSNDKVRILYNFNCCSILIGRKRHCTPPLSLIRWPKKCRRKCVFYWKAVQKLTGCLSAFNYWNTINTTTALCS